MHAFLSCFTSECLHVPVILCPEDVHASQNEHSHKSLLSPQSIFHRYTFLIDRHFVNDTNNLHCCGVHCFNEIKAWYRWQPQGDKITRTMILILGSLFKFKLTLYYNVLNDWNLSFICSDWEFSDLMSSAWQKGHDRLFETCDTELFASNHCRLCIRLENVWSWLFEKLARHERFIDYLMTQRQSKCTIQGASMFIYLWSCLQFYNKKR